MAKILIVDDVADNRTLLAGVLDSAQHEILQAADGAEGLKRAQAQDPDLIITDLYMPIMDGFELAQHLRADPRFKDTPIIFYTATYHVADIKDLALKLGARILEKPTHIREILRMVNETLGIGAPLVPSPPLEVFHQEHLRIVTGKLHEKIEGVSSRLAALIEFSLDLSEQIDPSQILQLLCRGTQEMIGAKQAIVCAQKRHAHEIRQYFSQGLDAETAGRLASEAPANGFLGQVEHERTSRRLRLLGQDLPDVGLPATFPPAESILAAPLVSPKYAYGWLCLLNKVGAGEFSEEDEQLATILGALAGRVYENGSLYAELRLKTAELERENAARRQDTDRLRRQAVALESAANGILITDRQGDIIWCNPAFTRMTGYGAEEVIGKNPRIFKSGHHDPSFYVELWTTVLAGKSGTAK